MHNRTINVNQESDFGPALLLIEEEACASLMEQEKNTCILLSEELMLHLLQSGYSPVQVRIKGKKHPYMEFSVSGEPDSFFILDSDQRQSALEARINGNILRTYDRYIDYRYNHQTGRYRIYPEQNQSAALTGEILDYYNHDQAAGEKHSRGSGLLLWIARKHPDMAAAGIILRVIRHLGALLLPVFTANMIDALTEYHDFFVMPVYMNLLFSFLALVCNLVFAWIDNHVYHRFTRTLESSLKMAVMEKIQGLSFLYHEQTSDGKLLSKLVSDVQFVKLLLYDYSLCILLVPEDLLFVIIVSMLRLPLMVPVLAVLLAFYILLIRLYSAPVRQAKEKMRRQTEKSNALFQEMLRMDQITRSHGLQQNESRRIRHSLRQVQQASTVQDNMQLRLNNVGFGMSQGFRLIVLAVAVYLASRDLISIGSVVLFVSLLDIMINSVQRLLDTMPQITQGVDSLASIDELLSEKNIESNGTRILPKPVKGEIELKHVRFHYKKDTVVFDDISMHIPAGSTVAIVGKSGTGKSTILGLILGLFEKESGQLLIDGIDIDALEKNHYRRCIAVVPQTPILFAGTLWENLTYGLQSCSTAQVTQVLRQVGLDSLILDHEEGLDLQLNEGGANLSGGQRQRIAIARALLRNPKIILLDEATSALDEDSEREVQAAIESAMHTCTMVIVAHRLHTIKKADLIYEVVDGSLHRFDSYEAYMRRSTE